eukprot:323657_1
MNINKTFCNMVLLILHQCNILMNVYCMKKIGINNKNIGQEILKYCLQINKANNEQNDTESANMNESVDKDDENIIDLSSLSTKEQSRLGKIRINEQVTVLSKVKCVVRCFDENKSKFGI